LLALPPDSGAGIGTSAPFRDVVAEARELAQIPRPILIRGERGTGKELLARFIHAASPRASGSYHVVNCGAFQEELLVSHLFGHERGAFTGATRRRAGIFEKANGGTLFLDEISNLSLRAQRRLHRVVEYQTFERVGGSESIQVDVRIIAATNTNLKKLIKGGKFMADLYDRLGFAELTLPPLRKRRDDVPLLIDHFIRLLHDEIPDLGRAEFTPEAIKALQSYDWPGNIRELKNVVERLYVVDRDRVIHAAELPLEVTVPEPMRGTFRERVATFEKGLLLSALRDAHGNQREAARALGMTYDQFRHYYKKHRLADRAD
jgi:psp operon transcriptional activator